MFYIRITTMDGCENLGLFVSLYEKVENGEHRYLLVCGDQTYDCKNITSILSPKYRANFRVDEVATDRTGGSRFCRMLTGLTSIC